MWIVVRNLFCGPKLALRLGKLVLQNQLVERESNFGVSKASKCGEMHIITVKTIHTIIRNI